MTDQPETSEKKFMTIQELLEKIETKQGEFEKLREQMSAEIHFSLSRNPNVSPAVRFEASQNGVLNIKKQIERYDSAYKVILTILTEYEQEKKP